MDNSSTDTVFSSDNSNTDINNSKFDLITKSISKNFIKKNVINILFKQDPDKNNLYIQINYKRNTDLNPLSFDLIFSVSVDHDYPESVPIVKNCTNFCFPTIYDSRNLIFSIINHNWMNKNEDDSSQSIKKSDNSIIEPIEEIIAKIPQFVNRLIENTNNKILVYYGDYKIDSIYDMNEFLGNSELDFFKINQHIKPKNENKEKLTKERYAVLSDIYFLLFDPVPTSKNLAKLLFWGDIRQISTNKGSPQNSDSNSEILILEWRNNNKVIQFEVSFVNANPKDFLDRANRKIMRLQSQYLIYQDDISKPGVDEQIISKMKDLNVNSGNIDKILLLVKYKEDLLEKQHSVNIVRELMSLYQKVIEILSAKEDTTFKIYLEKLHKMLTDNEIQEELEKDKTLNQTSTKSLIELSHSYQNDDQDEEY